MIDAGVFRQTMRQVASGVFVITTSLEGRVHAMTATAFLPLSLDPPLVLVCVHRSSGTHRALEAGRHFGVNVLSQEQAHLSGRFAGKTAERYRFDDLPCLQSPRGVTFFKHCAATIEVEPTQTAAGGDHTIFIGQVTWTDVDVSRTPLIHYQSAYHTLQPLKDLAQTVASRRRA